jgi:hypothetical protein
MIRAAANSESNSFQYLFGLWFVLTTCLVVGFATVGASSASGDPFELVDVTIGSSPPPAGAAVTEANLPAAADLYPSVIYGGLTWAVLESRLVPRAVTVSNKPIVIVEAVVANTTSDTTLRVRDSDVAIVWPDGRRDEVTRFEQLPGLTSFSLAPGETQDLTLVFKPQINLDPELASLVLEIAEPGRISAFLPLVGLAELSPSPVVVSLDQPSTVIGDKPDGGAQFIVAPQRATLDVNAGPYRAAVGERLVVVETSVLRAAAVPDAAYLDPGFWQLQDGLEVLHPVRVARSDTPSANEDLITVLFVASEELSETTLTVAAGTAQSSAYPIWFPDR